MTVTALQTEVHPAVKGGLVLEVTNISIQTDSIISITFADPLAGPLPSYVPGSHLVVQYGGGANAYSLTGSGSAPSEYTISVLQIQDGAGGSLTMHRLAIGDRVHVSLPRSAFAPAATATHHLLVAAGIGITPVLSHARSAAEWGMAASLIYVHRPDAGAHVAEARELLGPALTECADRDSFLKVLTEKLTTQQLGTHLFVCGPAAFMDTVLDHAREHGWSTARLHSEAFGATQLEEGEPSFELDAVSQLFKDWMGNKHEDILGYRDAVHRSVVTGTESAKHHTRWLNAMDDSLERYLRGPSQDVDANTRAAVTSTLAV